MDHMILGLLILKPRSLYELQQCMEAGLHLMYSSSPGSIQAALKKLLNAGFIEFQEETQGRRKKKVYSITASGREDFRIWVSSPMKTGSARDPELGKLYFMGLSDKESRIQNLREGIESLRQPYAVLSAIVSQGETMQVPPEAEEILHYQLASARFGRDFIRFQIDWYESFLKEEVQRK